MLLHKVKENNKHKYLYECIKICLIYFVFGVLWIYFSDRITDTFFNGELLLIINTYKGWLFVFVTTIFLYFLISWFIKKVNLIENDLILSYKELSKSENKYKTLINEMQLGFALYEGTDNDTVDKYRLIDVNDSHYRITGLIKEEIIGKCIYEILPEMKEQNLQKLQHTIETGEPTHYENFQKKINTYYEIISYRPRKLQLAVIINDITKRKIAEEESKISENNFKNIFENSADAIFLVDENKIIDCNCSAVALLGFDSKSEVLGKSLYEFSPEEQPNGQLSNEMLSKIYDHSKTEGKYRFVWYYTKSDESLIPVEIIMTKIINNDKGILHCLCRDIRENKKMEEELKYLSTHDYLTGLYNRRYLIDELNNIDVENSYPFSITVADINGLKLINDSFGHLMGDRLIKKVAEVMLKGAQPGDVVSRLAGDEFVILSPNTDSCKAEQTIENIKVLAAKEKVGLIDISISFGYETKRNVDEDIAIILKKAEDNMYRNKLFESPSMRGKTINVIITTLYEKNKREEQHSRRVSELCESMGYALGLNQDKVTELKTVGLLHDIGKIAVEEGLLNKNGKLSVDEWQEIKKHPEIGYRILSTVNDLSEMANYVLAHHERWDGKGYPKGLKGEEIPIQSRIIAIADAFDAMISERSYRNALDKQVAIQELKNNSNLQFDSYFVKVFIEKVI